MSRPLHVERMRLRWGEMDALRHLNNVAYFRYFEQARISWFDSLAIDYAPNGEGPILGSITCRFLKPAVYPADVDIELHAGRIGNASFALEHRMRCSTARDVVFAEGEAVLVWVDLASGRSRPLPERVRAALQP
jgi:acyl-CoA thioester hydrolase